MRAAVVFSQVVQSGKGERLVWDSQGQDLRAGSSTYKLCHRSKHQKVCFNLHNEVNNNNSYSSRAAMMRLQPETLCEVLTKGHSNIRDLHSQQKGFGGPRGLLSRSLSCPQSWVHLVSSC